MQDIFLIGLNHKTAPVALRECLAFSEDEVVHAITTLPNAPAIREVMLLSTCNRVELLMIVSEMNQAFSSAKSFLAEFKQFPQDQFETLLYQYKGEDAVRHLFRVAASLDSMVVGEPQILGQIKAAYQIAVKQKSAGVVLNRLLHRTFFVAKRVRSETGIGDHAVSISYAAIELGRKIFGDLTQKKVLLIGAGEMAELAVEHLIRNQVGDIFVANRTFDRGVVMAQRYRGSAVRFEEIPATLEEVDIIISSTGASEYIVLPHHVKDVMRKRRNKPLFFIDIAVPRDIDPKTNRINNVYVYDIDDLKGVVDHNIEDRNREAIKAERIIDEAVIQFRTWYDSLHVVPTIKALRNKIEKIADAEMQKTLQSMVHLSEADRQAMARMQTALINKVLHHPTVFLKGNGCQGDKAVYLDTVRKLFQLDDHLK
jgi:glutamyl-tRNA reductase